MRIRGSHNPYISSRKFCLPAVVGVRRRMDQAEGEQRITYERPDSIGLEIRQEALHTNAIGWQPLKQTPAVFAPPDYVVRATNDPSMAGERFTADTILFTSRARNEAH
jgi:hypothetical protein